MGRCIAFIDGENLLNRFESMLNEGRKPRTEPNGNDFVYRLGYVRHSPRKFVWNPNIIREVTGGPLIRVNYYSTFEGSVEDMETLQGEIASLKSNLVIGSSGSVEHVLNNATNLVPKIFKKQKRGSKTKSVDINICVDVLTQAYQGSVDDIYIVSGDGDYAPLIEQTMRTGKRVHVAALSSGLSPVMRRISDHFVDLDQVMFV